MSVPGPSYNPGWTCPVCGRGLSPYTPWCPCSGERRTFVGTGTNQEPIVPECNHEWTGFNTTGGPYCKKCNKRMPEPMPAYTTCRSGVYAHDIPAEALDKVGLYVDDPASMSMQCAGL